MRGAFHSASSDSGGGTEVWANSAFQCSAFVLAIVMLWKCGSAGFSDGLVALSCMALLSYLQQLRTNANPGPLQPRLVTVLPKLEEALEQHLAALPRPAPWVQR